MTRGHYLMLIPKIILESCRFQRIEILRPKPSEISPMLFVLKLEHELLPNSEKMAKYKTAH